MRALQSCRILKFLFPDILCRNEEPGANNIYLTFDDGPNPLVTPQILNILANHNVKATFFCTGANVQKNPELYSRIIKEEHATGNHTYNHLSGWKTSTKEYLADVEQCSTLVHSRLFRPPYGRFTVNQYRELKKKYRIVLWDVPSFDYNKRYSVQNCLEIVKKNTSSGSILLFHDNAKTIGKTPELLSETIEILKERKYEFKILPCEK